MSVQTIGPIPGVPDQLITVLNDRFRELSAGSATTADSPQEYKTNDNGLTYRLRDGRWIYASGVILDLLAKRPANFDASDAGALFLASDTYQTYRWSGVAWVEVTPANDVQIAYASGSITFTGTTVLDVTGATLTLNRAGRYLIIGVFGFLGVAADFGTYLLGVLSTDGTDQAQKAYWYQPGVSVPTSFSTAVSASESWIYTAPTAGKIVKLRGVKGATGGGNTSSIITPHTSITAIWIGP